MARISVVGSPFEKVLLQDLDKKQSLREHTINPPGEERYVRPIDVAAVQAVLDSHNSGTGTTEDAAALITATQGADDISQAAIQSAITETLTAGELDSIEALLSYEFTETGHFLLSFNDGVIAGLVAQGWVKVFVSDGSALFTL